MRIDDPWDLLAKLVAVLACLAALAAFIRVSGYAPSAFNGSHEAWAWVAAACVLAVYALDRARR
jgi:hypothetical protein